MIVGNPGPRGTKKSRGVRCDNEVWRKAMDRSQAEGISLNLVLEEFLDAYGKGLVDFGKPAEGEGEDDGSLA